VDTGAATPATIRQLYQALNKAEKSGNVLQAEDARLNVDRTLKATVAKEIAWAFAVGNVERSVDGRSEYAISLSPPPSLIVGQRCILALYLSATAEPRNLKSEQTYYLPVRGDQLALAKRLSRGAVIRISAKVHAAELKDWLPTVGPLLISVVDARIASVVHKP
jgi:hypothetical protein